MFMHMQVYYSYMCKQMLNCMQKENVNNVDFRGHTFIVIQQVVTV